MPASFHVGRGLTVVALHEDGVELEGIHRLAPGREVVLYGVAPVPSRGRRAYVGSWRLVGTGRHGILYRGYCGWLADRRERTPVEGGVGSG